MANFPKVDSKKSNHNLPVLGTSFSQQTAESGPAFTSGSPRLPGFLKTEPSRTFGGSGIFKGKAKVDDADMNVNRQGPSASELTGRISARRGSIQTSELDELHNPNSPLIKVYQIVVNHEGNTHKQKDGAGFYGVSDKNLLTAINSRGIVGYKAISKPLNGTTYFVPEKKWQEIEDCITGKEAPEEKVDMTDMLISRN